MPSSQPVKHKTYRDFLSYQRSYSISLEIFRLTLKFPKEEKYALSDQMRRASRSIPSNLAEGWAKRDYNNVFKRHVIDSIGSCEEMKVWLDYCKDLSYIQDSAYTNFQKGYDEIGAMLHALHRRIQSK